MAVTSGSVPSTKKDGVRYLKFDWSSTKDSTTYTINWTLSVIGRTTDTGWWDLRQLDLQTTATAGTIDSISNPTMSAQYGGGPYGDVASGLGDGTYGTYARFVDDYVNSGSSRGNYLYKLYYKVNWPRQWGVGAYYGANMATQSMPMCSGSFKIHSNSSGQASFKISLSANAAGTTISGSSTFELPVTMTAVGAPSNLKVNSSIVKTGSSITLNWTAGANGTNNTISSYIIQYSTNNGSSWAELASNVKTTSHSFTAGSRGTVYSFRIMSIGSGGMNSGFTTSGNICTVNSLPNAPTLSTSASTFNGKPIIITLTAGNTNNSGQTASLYYAKSSSGTKYSVSSTFTVPVSDFASATSVTYYFWTYDGLEYSSSYASQTIKYNATLPVISCSGTDYKTAAPVPVSGAIYKPQVNLSISNLSEGSASFSNIQYWVSVDDGNFVNINGTSYTGNPDTKYKFQVTAFDGIRTLTSSSSGYFFVPAIPVPNFTSLKNDRTVSDESEYFDEYFQITAPYDTYLEISGISLGGYACSQFSFSNTSKGQEWVGKVPSGVASGEFVINFSGRGSITLNKTRVADYPIANFVSLSYQSVNMYESDIVNATYVKLDKISTLYMLNLKTVSITFNGYDFSTITSNNYSGYSTYTLASLYTNYWSRYATVAKRTDLEIKITVKNIFDREFSTTKTLTTLLEDTPINENLVIDSDSSGIIYSERSITLTQTIKYRKPTTINYKIFYALSDGKITDDTQINNLYTTGTITLGEGISNEYKVVNTSLNFQAPRIYFNQNSHINIRVEISPANLASKSVSEVIAGYSTPTLDIVSTSYAQGTVTANIACATNCQQGAFSSGKIYINDSASQEISYNTTSATLTKNIPITEPTIFTVVLEYTPQGKEDALSVSKTFTIYVDVPTIAYRKNSLGINTSEVDEDAVLEINPMNNKQVIYLGASGRRIAIDLEDLKINSIIISGGSW